MRVLKFTNCYLLQEDDSLKKGDLYVDIERGVIISGKELFFTAKEYPIEVIDLEEDILSPGLIDVQINGAYGVDFSLWPPINTENLPRDQQIAAYLAGLDKVSAKIVETGTTSFLPTIITQQQDLYRELIPLLGPRSSENSAHVLGYHAEGPFIAHSRKGAHAPPFLLTATNGVSSIESVYDSQTTKLETPNTGIKLLTMAPDVEGVAESIGALAALPDVVISIGHSDATVELAAKSVRDGARFITHLFNAMPQLHHRDPGVIGLLGNQVQRPFYGLIVDGVHVHPNAVRLAYDAHPDGCILVTDAMPLMDPHLEDGIHDWRDGRRLLKQGPRLYLENTKTLAGSASSLDECVRNMTEFTNSPSYAKALSCATYHPAQLLQLSNKGNLRVGSDADLVVINRTTGEVKSTFIKGKCVYGN
ncbi:Metallo-dependent hydrolase [Wallemia mellicola]|nr:Metallo-dependent hydrolase [Wallemia mellicola]